MTRRELRLMVTVLDVVGVSSLCIVAWSEVMGIPLRLVLATVLFLLRGVPWLWRLALRHARLVRAAQRSGRV